MLIIVISENRTWFINEYWIIIPVVAGVQYYLYRRKRKKQQKEQQLQLANAKIFHLAMDNLHALAQLRGGELIEQQICEVGKGVRFVNSDRIRIYIGGVLNGIKGVVKRKGIIYITESAFCALVSHYDLVNPVLSLFGEVRFLDGRIRLTRPIVGIGKTISSLILANGLGDLLLTAGSAANPYWTAGKLLTGRIVAHLVSEKVIGKVATSLIKSPLDKLTARIPGITEIVVVNYEDYNNQSGLTMPAFGTPDQCLVPDYLPFNMDTCDIPYADPTELGWTPELVDGIVTLEDIKETLDLKSKEGSYDFIPKDANELPKLVRQERIKAKMVSMSDIAPDTTNLPEDETWDIDENSINRVTSVLQRLRGN